MTFKKAIPEMACEEMDKPKFVAESRSYSLSVGLIRNSAAGLVFFFHLQIVHKLILIFPKWIYNFQKYTPAGEEVHKRNGSAVPNSLWTTQPSPAHWTKTAALLELLTRFPLGFSLFAIQSMWLLIRTSWFNSTAWLDD